MRRTRAAALSRCIAAGVFLILASSESTDAQTQSGPIVMRSEGSTELQWWIVDPTSGVAAFYGGDIIAICRGEPGGHDLLDLQEVKTQQSVASNVVAQGKDIGASLWDHAPPFVVPRLCQDILSRGAPMATGTANLTFTGRFPTTWGDPEVVSTYGMTASGSMRTPEGEIPRVNSNYRCRTKGADTRCTQGVVTNR